MLLDPAEDAHAVLAVHHVHGQAPLAKAASAPDPVQVGLIVRVPVLVHREIKVDDNRHLLHIDTCREGGVCEAVRVGDKVPVKAATPVLWAGEAGTSGPWAPDGTGRPATALEQEDRLCLAGTTSPGNGKSLQTEKSMVLPGEQLPRPGLGS